MFESRRYDEGSALPANGALRWLCYTSLMSGYSSFISCNILTGCVRERVCVCMLIHVGREGEMKETNRSQSNASPGSQPKYHVEQNRKKTWQSIKQLQYFFCPFRLRQWTCFHPFKKKKIWNCIGWGEMDLALSVLGVRYGQIIAGSVQQRRMITGFIVSRRHNQPWFSNLTSPWFMSHARSLPTPLYTILLMLICSLLAFFFPSPTSFIAECPPAVTLPSSRKIGLNCCRCHPCAELGCLWW